jgi:hypothetical protein
MHISQAALFFLSFLHTGEQSQFCTNVSRRPDEESAPSALQVVAFEDMKISI